MSDREELKNMALSFYTRLFTTKAVPVGGELMKGIFSLLQTDLRVELEREYSS